jgi:hypothetical protein
VARVTLVRSTLNAVPPFVGVKLRLYTAKSLKLGVTGNIVLDVSESVNENDPFPSGKTSGLSPETTGFKQPVKMRNEKIEMRNVRKYLFSLLFVLCTLFILSSYYLTIVKGIALRYSNPFLLTVSIKA